jgi:hypothetical protein
MHQFCSVAWLALTYPGFRKIPTESNVFYQSAYNAVSSNKIGMDTEKFECLARGYLLFEKGWMKLVSGGRVKR